MVQATDGLARTTCNPISPVVIVPTADRKLMNEPQAWPTMLGALASPPDALLNHDIAAHASNEMGHDRVFSGSNDILGGGGSS